MTLYSTRMPKKWWSTWLMPSRSSREATILLYATALDPHLQKMTELANLWCSASTVSRPRKGKRSCHESRERWRLAHGWLQDRPKTPSHQTPRPLLATGDTLKASRTSLLVLAQETSKRSLNKFENNEVEHNEQNNETQVQDYR